jgi:hypothetical protein
MIGLHIFRFCPADMCELKDPDLEKYDQANGNGGVEAPVHTPIKKFAT